MPCTIEEILHPRSIAVVGASNTKGGRGSFYLPGLLKFGFKGKIYPVNPKHAEVMGVKAYPTLLDIPEPVDFVISSVPADAVPKMLEDAVQKGVKTVHLYTARFSETGRPEAAALEREILRLTRAGGMHLLGPNCMGIYYPSGRISWSPIFAKQCGAAGLASQSGNLAGDIIETAPLRGVFFSKAFSYGNAIDLNECDFLDYLFHDPETRIIMMYVEGVKDGRRFFELLKRATKVKPVIILKGGRGASGARATASHTASLAGSIRTWEAMVAQAGAVSADSFEELIDLAASFYFLPEIKGYRVGVAGGAGGPSVLAADQCELAGLQVIPLPSSFREELKRRDISVWDWIGNPADFSIRTDEKLTMGLLMELMAKTPEFDLVMALLRPPERFGIQADTPPDVFLKERLRLEACKAKPLLVTLADMCPGAGESDGRAWKATCEMRSALIKLGIPFYPTIQRAATAARKVADYYQRRAQSL